jgi:nucleotide-binding universal stress UspA family protein
MHATYITGYDGSEGAVAAMRFCTRLAAGTGGEVVAASVYPHSRWAFRVDDDERDAGEPRHDAGAPVGAPDVVMCSVGAPSPAEGLHRLAAEQHASLLAVGVTHRGALGRLVPGGVPDHLVHGAPCPVAVVPAEWADRPIRVVAAAYDGSDESRLALAAAVDLAGRAGARVRVLSVWQSLMPAYLGTGFVYASTELEADSLELRRREVADVVADLPDELHPEGVVRTGDPGATLVDACRDDVDALFMGSRGYGPAKSVLVGSVSRYVVDHASCPVIVVPSSARPGAGPGETAGDEHSRSAA